MFRYMVLLLVLISSAAQPIGWEMVYDPTACADLLNQLHQLEQELVTLKEQAKSLQQELKQLLTSQYQWGNAEEVINNVADILNKTDGIMYTADNLQEQFETMFPGYTPMVDIGDEYKKITNTLQNTLGGILHAIGTTAKDFKNASSRIKFLEQQVQNAQGQTQAIQAASQIAAETVNQLEQMHQTLLNQTNAMVAYFAAETQENTNIKANVDQVISGGDSNVTGILNNHPLDISLYYLHNAYSSTVLSVSKEFLC